MEPIPEQSHASLLSKLLLSKLSHIMWSCTLFFVASSELFLILQKLEPKLHFLPLCFLLICFLLKWLLSRPSPVYIVDFSCLKPPNYCRVPFAAFIENASQFKLFEPKSLTFMAKALQASGQSENTYLPSPLHFIPPKTDQNEAIREVHKLLFPIIDDLFAKTNVSPIDIDILIVNCSCFCPSPSLSSIVINKYSMRSDIKSFHISGSGCSASALGIDMAQRLLRVHKNSTAMVLSTEILSTGWYTGNEIPKLILNCIFRMGSAAILLSNKNELKKNAKYRVLRTLRTQSAFLDDGYLSAILEEDSVGKRGFSVRKNVLHVAREALRSNITALGYQVLPLSETLRYVMSLFKLRILKKDSKGKGIYVPNFMSVIQHICLPCTGMSVIRETGKALRLSERDIEPALATMHRFGNQSSSSLWYELAYLEAKQRVKKGDTVWLLGMGSGPKCTSVLLKSVTPLSGEPNNAPWADCIQHYPLLIH
ncbi:hypothetical protein HN51_020043 [Arachis hypogaea]|uniref:3-ketoacyl-CoA synthase n=2 Tax=Arachis hypogaea TaxID=3818 RepID=A0A445BZ67_ARAHY|nr:3-ketoacyl-CoA synthase 5 [Arachis hypogaea]QHO31909.1 3-ketoacyl-CoA synthase [Arachis hypogaea]RYR44033.1 hypothetical protein Ahy_A08g040413 isoform B [Arachis hypogaea]